MPLSLSANLLSLRAWPTFLLLEAMKLSSSLGQISTLMHNFCTEVQLLGSVIRHLGGHGGHRLCGLRHTQSPRTLNNSRLGSAPI